MKYISVTKRGLPKLITGMAGAAVGATAGYLIGSALGYKPEALTIIGLHAGGELTKRVYKHYFE